MGSFAPPHVVIATIRRDCLERFLAEWRDAFARAAARVIVVEDQPQRTFAIDPASHPFSVAHYAWSDIEEDLGSSAWILPRRTSAIKSYGFWKAYEEGAEWILALDDDCYPATRKLEGFPVEPLIERHAANLFERRHSEASWASSTRGLRPRGLPYEATTREVLPERIWLSHGLWANVPDVDGETQLGLSDFPHVSEYFVEQLIPRGVFFPMCGMNLAWKRPLTPAMFFMLMGADAQGASWGYHRFDDIWAGLFAKKILDHLGYRAYSGHPVVWHDRASDAATNAEREAPGRDAHEHLSVAVDGIELRGTTVVECYLELAERLPMEGPYWDRLREAMRLWGGLFR